MTDMGQQSKEKAEPKQEKNGGQKKTKIPT